VWVWWKCWNFVRLSRSVDRQNKCAAAHPPFSPSQEISRSSEIGERASVRSCVRVCVHASSGVVLRPFRSLLLVRSAGAQSGGFSLGGGARGGGGGGGELDLFCWCSVLF
jgi:hypothetical protein